MRRYTHAKRRCLVINFAGDTRYGEGVVATHDRATLQAAPCHALREVHDRVADVDVIGVDEGQFFPDLVEYVSTWCDLGKVRRGRVENRH